MNRYEILVLMLIIFLAIVLRLKNIKAEIWDIQAGRQIGTAMVARNLCLNGFNIFYPQVDYGGPGPGYLEMEFPIYNFLVAIFYAIFGIKEIIGRLLSIFFSLVAIIFIYLLTRLLYNPHSSLLSALFFAISPISQVYSRNFQPEALLMASISAGMYFLFRFILDKKNWQFFMAILGLSLSFLIKFTSLYLLLPVAYLIWVNRRENKIRKKGIWILLLPLILCLAWYYHSYLLGKRYVSWRLFEHLTYSETVNYWFSTAWLYQIFIRGLGMEVLFIIGIIPVLYGLLNERKNFEIVFHLWLIGIILFYFISAWSIYRHNYYHFPIVIPLAVFFGKGLDLMIRKIEEHYQRRRKNFSLILNNFATYLFFLIFSILIALPMFISGPEAMWRVWNSGQMELGLKLKEISQPDELINSASPIVHYYSQRKGWFELPAFNTTQDIEKQIQEGLDYFIVSNPPISLGWQKQYSYSNHILKYIHKRFVKVADEPGGIIYKIKEQKR